MKTELNFLDGLFILQRVENYLFDTTCTIGNQPVPNLWDSVTLVRKAQRDVRKRIAGIIGADLWISTSEE